MIRVVLPEKINGVTPKQQSAESVDVEIIDFFKDRRYLAQLMLRENGACFYCLRQVRTDNCQLDHVVAQAEGVDNFYRNIVAACHECSTPKQSKEGADFVRDLYRRGVLSQRELQGRLSALDLLKTGKLKPNL